MTKSFDYPDVPENAVSFASLSTLPGIQIPGETGIYFLWKKSRLMYVGQASSLLCRLTSRHQHVGTCSHVSWLYFEDSELVYAECYYIAKYRPPLNRATPTPTVGLGPSDLTLPRRVLQAIRGFGVNDRQALAAVIDGAVRVMLKASSGSPEFRALEFISNACRSDGPVAPEPQALTPEP